MSRRITSKTVDKVNGTEAIQPSERDQVSELHAELFRILASEALPGRQGMTVFHVSSTKESIKEGATASSKVIHRWDTRITIEHLPQNTAKEEVAGGDDVPQTRQGEKRLVKLTNVFLQKFAEDSGTNAAEALKWLIIVGAWLLLSRMS
jgi:hypothetical protein